LQLGGLADCQVFSIFRLRLSGDKDSVFVPADKFTAETLWCIIMKRLATIILIIVSTISAFADEDRYMTEFKSADGNISIKLEKNNWVVRNKDEKKLLYSIKDKEYSSMFILISNDARNIVIIDDYINNTQFLDRPIIWVFVEGKEVSSFKPNEIIKNYCNAGYSVSHVSWCLSDFSLDNSTKRFHFSTYEFFEMTIDLNNGKILEQKRPEGFDKNTVIVYGEFRKNNGTKAKMKVIRYVSEISNPENEIEFNTDYFGKGQWKKTLMIKDGLDITPKKYLLETMFLDDCK